MGKQTELTMSDHLSLTDKVTARVVRNLAMTPAAEEFLAELAHRTRLSEGDVIRLGLACSRQQLRPSSRGSTSESPSRRTCSIWNWSDSEEAVRGAERPKAVNIAGLLDQSIAFEFKTETPAERNSRLRREEAQAEHDLRTQERPCRRTPP